jgi:putative nucleotidyltransferase with HDIG domain
LFLPSGRSPDLFSGKAGGLPDYADKYIGPMMPNSTLSQEQAAAPPLLEENIRVGQVVSALSSALDLSTGQPAGHSVRSCMIGMRIGKEIGLSRAELSDLFYALLLKDCGCSGNASKTFHALGSDDLKAKRDVKTTDWTRTSWETLQFALSHVAPGKPFIERTRALFRLAAGQKVHAKNATKIRCERGATLTRLMGLSGATSFAILNLDEHWDGRGFPEGLRGAEIPLHSRIMLLAQTLEVFLVASGPQAAIEVVNRRRRTWFDPDLVKAANSLSRHNLLWHKAFSTQLPELCLETEPDPKMLEPGGTSLENISLAFSNIVDAKSPFTFNHSLGVANAAVATARVIGLPRERIVFLRHAALLHDLGKLGVSNTILEKPAKLDDNEWQAMKRHPMDTWKILRAIPGFGEMSNIAGSHHEKLNGSGYFRGVTAEYLPIESRILAVADMFDALAAQRPYRDALPREKVFQIIREETPHALDASCVEALEQSGSESNQTFIDLESLNDQLKSYA